MMNILSKFKKCNVHDSKCNIIEYIIKDLNWYLFQTDKVYETKQLIIGLNTYL